MAIRVRNNRTDFTPAPIGIHRSVCCDIVELGLVDTQWGKKRKVDIKWQIGEEMENGKPFLLTKRYGATLHPKSTLRIDLESWRGKALTEEQAEDFDLEVLLDKNCQINVMHNITDAGTFANVTAVVPASKGSPPLKVRDYTRVCARDDYVTPDIDDPREDPPEASVQQAEDDIPF